MDELVLNKTPTLQDFQKYVYDMKRLRGFKIDKMWDCCLLAEEVGELISAVRKNNTGGSIGSGSIPGDVKEELADVFILILSLANLHGIDLEEAFREKEEKNKKRTWKRL